MQSVCMVSRLIRTNELDIGANRAGNHAHTLHSYISVMDEVKINEQNKSIATGLFYVHIKFEAI